MTSPFDSLATFPVTRAQAYPHTWPDDSSPEEAPILGVDHFLVDTWVVKPGTVTLAASTRNAGVDAYGFEFDVTPSDARALGRQLIAAAAACETAD